MLLSPFHQAGKGTQKDSNRSTVTSASSRAGSVQIADAPIPSVASTTAPSHQAGQRKANQPWAVPA